MSLHNYNASIHKVDCTALEKNTWIEVRDALAKAISSLSKDKDYKSVFRQLI